MQRLVSRKVEKKSGDKKIQRFEDILRCRRQGNW